jgi:F-type H+-transporting ATPase subunit delta
MAELSTIARPYAEALFSAATAAGAHALGSWGEIVDEMASVTAHPRVAEVIADPNVGAARTLDLLTGLMKSSLPSQMANFLRTLIENGRLATLPEVARQYRLLKNEAEGVADCVIETAFAMSDVQVNELIDLLTKKFGLRLKPEVKVDAALIGGVRVTVGDHVLDTSVKTQLARMQAALTA